MAKGAARATIVAKLEECERLHELSIRVPTFILCVFLREMKK